MPTAAEMIGKFWTFIVGVNTMLMEKLIGRTEEPLVETPSQAKARLFRDRIKHSLEEYQIIQSKLTNTDKELLAGMGISMLLLQQILLFKEIQNFLISIPDVSSTTGQESRIAAVMAVMAVLVRATLKLKEGEQITTALLEGARDALQPYLKEELEMLAPAYFLGQMGVQPVQERVTPGCSSSTQDATIGNRASEAGREVETPLLVGVVLPKPMALPPLPVSTAVTTAPMQGDKKTIVWGTETFVSIPPREGAQASDKTAATP